MIVNYISIRFFFPPISPKVMAATRLTSFTANNVFKIKHKVIFMDSRTCKIFQENNKR